MDQPEVLAPAGDFDSVRAAVENGADAVYFGVGRFNARARARNFSVEELPDLLSFLRLRGVRGYVAFNTLVFSNELEEAAALLERVIAAGPDALILQDFGIARLVREISPDVTLHASTQTTTTCAEQMGSLRELGFSRVILARELSIDEIRRIKGGTDMELEVFAHGALCIAYSGQCLTSEALGGRSANRGACAQACRLPYEMIVDGRPVDLGDQKYLISPQDLAAYELIPELLGLVAGLKIEGRLKTPEYVAATTRAYRKAVDQATARFSRGFSPGFLFGIDHQSLARGLSPKKRGVFLGEVWSVRGGRVAIALQAPLKPGDGIVFDYGRPDQDEPGGRVTHLWGEGQSVEFEARGVPPPKPGWKVWKTDDPAVNRRLRATFARTGARVAIDATVDENGDLLRVTFTDGRHSVTGETGPLQVAQKRPPTADYLRKHLGRLGDTPFELRGLDVRLENVMVPVSRINDLRRRLSADLEEARRENPGFRVEPGALGRLRTTPGRTEGPVRLAVLCRSMDHVGAALEEGVTSIECDFDDVKKYGDAVAAVRAKGASIHLAPPRIFKPGEEGILKVVASAAPDGVLVRSTAHLGFFSGLDLVGDFSLNVANEFTADWVLSKGLSRIVPSYDLNVQQLEALLGRIDPGRVELVAHQHMPMFHNEHCVIAAVLSDGKDSTDCGRPCDRHSIALRDWSGRMHPLKADVGCRNTIYNEVPQSASPWLRRLIDLGIRWFRVELLLEDAAATRRLIRGYRDVLDGRSDGRTLWKKLRAANVMGVTRGPLGREE